MGKRGRKPNDPTVFAQNRRENARKRIKEYRISNGLTQEKMAEICGVSTRQLQHIEKGDKDTGVSKAIANRLEKISHIYAEYWTGESDIKRPEGYLDLIEAKQNDRKELERIENTIKSKYREKIEEYCSFFSNPLLGYRYRCLADPNSVHDMLMVLSGSEYIGGWTVNHSLTPYKNLNKEYIIDQKQLEGIIKRLQYTLDFECFSTVNERK